MLEAPARPCQPLAFLEPIFLTGRQRVCELIIPINSLIRFRREEMSLSDSI